MVMAVDQARQHDMAGQIDHAVRRLRQIRAVAHLLDAVAADEKAAVANLAAGSVHRHQRVGVAYEERLLGHVFSSGLDV